MGRFNKRIFSIVITSLLASLSYQACAETMRDAVLRTVNYNPDVRIQAKIRSAADEGVRQARAGYLPTLDVNAGYGREWANNFNSNFSSNALWRTDFGVNARQMIFDGFATPNEVRRNKARTNAEAYRTWGTAEDKALQAIQAYLDVLRNEELVGIARRNVGIHENTFGMVERLSEQGLGREADTDQTGGRVDLAKANLKSAENDLENARIRFQKVTGRLPDHLSGEASIDSYQMPRNERDAIMRALRNHPTLKSAIEDISQARGEYEASKSKFYPRLDLVGSLTQSHNVGGSPGPDRDRLIELELQYNLFQGGHDIAKTRESGFHVQQAAEIRNRTEYETIENMRLAWQAYESSQGRLPLLAAHRDAASGTTHSYTRQFTLGKRTILDVLDSQNEYFTSQQDYVNERYALLFAKYRILNAEGRLVEFMHVPLPAEACIPYKV